MSDTKLEELITRIPSFDISVSNPFKTELSQLKVEIPYNVAVKADLPPLIKVEIPVIDKDIDELVYIISQDMFDLWSSSFEEVIASIPIFEEELVKYNSETKEALSKEIKSRRLVKLSVKPGKITIEIKTPMQTNVPEDMRDRYSIKIRLKRGLTPEVRDIIENRLTKEFKITRMIKKMEIIRDEKIINELEKLLQLFSKKIKRR